jgi:hypothetical protein
MTMLRLAAMLAMLALLAPLAAGCGSAGEVERRAPIATLDGAMTAQALTSPPTSSFRIAVIWTDGKHYVATQDVPATPVFPSRFHLQFVDPPPASVMVPVDTGNGSIAVGAIVAYEDKNGNGALDLVDEDASSFVDRILGTNSSLLLVYGEGVTATDDTPAVLGYELMKLEGCARGEDCLFKSSILPLTTAYDLPLTDDPAFAWMMCTNGGGGSTSSGGTTPDEVGPGPDGWPAKDDPAVECRADRKSYVYTKCTSEVVGLCKGTNESCTSTAWTFAGSTPPAAWPCP